MNTRFLRSDDHPNKKDRRRWQQQLLLSRRPAATISNREGRLSEDEIATLQSAYAEGAVGELLIGMQQRVRLLTLLMPPQPSQRAAVMAIERAIKRLAAMRCDGYIHTRPAHLRSASHSIPAMVITQYICGEQECVAVLLNSSPRRQLACGTSLEDEVYRQLRQAFV